MYNINNRLIQMVIDLVFFFMMIGIHKLKFLKCMVKGLILNSYEKNSVENGD